MSHLPFSRCFGVLVLAVCCLTNLQAAEDRIDPKKLVGIWLYKDAALVGGLEGYTICQADGTQANIVYFTKINRWLFEEFTWKLEDRNIIATETRTNIPNLAQGTVSVSEIVHLDETTLVCRERGKEHTETRVEALPELFKSKLEELRRVEAAKHEKMEASK